MNGKRVINIFGGPGVGKSTIAAGLFYRMKCEHYDVELLSEYAKKLTYEERWDILKNDQLTILAKQHRDLAVIYKHRKYVIVDSPLLLSQIYFNPKTNVADAKLFMPLVVQLFLSYPNINFVIKRNDILPYEEKGRFQTKEEAEEIDKKVVKFLDVNMIEYKSVMAGDTAVELIFQYLRNEMII